MVVNEVKLSTKTKVNCTKHRVQFEKYLRLSPGGLWSVMADRTVQYSTWLANLDISVAFTMSGRLTREPRIADGLSR